MYKRLWACLALYNHVIRDGLHCHQCNNLHMMTEKKHIVVTKCEGALNSNTVNLKLQLI